MTLPDMSREDRAKALESAKKARSDRASILRCVSGGELSVVDVLDLADADESYARIRVSALLRAVPGYGEVRTEKLMERLRIAESRRLRGLGPRQRAALREHFSTE